MSGKYLQNIETGEVKAWHRMTAKSPLWVECDGPEGTAPATPVETVELTPPQTTVTDAPLSAIGDGFPAQEDEFLGEPDGGYE